MLSKEELRLRDEREGTPFGQMRTIIEMDPPEHIDFRKVASGFFTPRSIHRLDEIVVECAREQVDKLGEEGECDFIETIAQRHPLRVLATILGIDRDDEEKVLELTQQLFAGDDPDLQRKGESREEATAQMGLDNLRFVPGDPAIHRTLGDVARHLLGADQDALDLRIIDRRKVRATRVANVEAGPGQQASRRLLQRALRESQPQAGRCLLFAHFL